MTNKALNDSFRVLEKQFGLKKTCEETMVYESDTHRVSIELMDRHSTVACDVVLKALPQSGVDVFSIIGFYHASALDAFLGSAQKRTDDVVAVFIANELTGSCAAVFQIVETAQWMRLHQHHLQSLRRRNDVFWARVSGFDEGNDLSERATY